MEKKIQQKYHIAISGSYGGLNLGDEAILEGILQQLRASFENLDIVVFSRNPKDTEERHGVKAIPIHEMHKEEIFEELKKLDLLILGGGGLLFDGIVKEYLRDVVWAKELHVPVMIYAISVGPLNSEDSKKFVAEVLNSVDIITVREGESKKILQDLGVKKEIEVTADPALLINPEPFTKEMLEKEGILEGMKFVALSVREPGLATPDLDINLYHDMLANSADFMVERFQAKILFIPMEPEQDPSQSHAVISKMSNVQEAMVLKGKYTSSQILGLMQHMSFAVGMRLHFLIFAALQSIPFVPLPYATKVNGFLQDLEMDTLGIVRWNPGKVCAMVDRAWDDRMLIKKKLQEKLSPLKAKAERTNVILCEFLKGLTPKSR